jgi:hypothetical protein
VNSGDVVALDTAERYLALSYVWGQVMGTKQSVIYHDVPHDNIMCTIGLETQPATIRDAITLVRALHERYLWIDSLCIDQEDPSDKAEIVSNMDAIYRGAYLTIVAADGKDADAGLTRLRGHAKYPERPICIVNRQRCLSLLPEPPKYEDTLPKTVWSTRGWTYQEMMLSAKSFVFTEDEVSFFAEGKRERES